MWIVNFVSFCLILKFVAGDEVLFNIPQGTLKGLKTTTIFHGKPYYSFKSIPYAKPNIGLNKFRPPEPAEGWIGVRDATKFRSFCVQFSPIYNQILGDDDCLFLNVYTPDLNKNAKRAIIIFIHGGGFNFGDGDDTLFGPDFLVEADFVLVTFNYRLGATGFLNTGDVNAPGNAGLKDQVMAMRWVQDNIEHFSGSPTRVTILGQGTGGTSVQYHLLSPMSQGLFSGVTISDGSIGASHAISYTPLIDAYILADALEIKTNSTADLVQQLALIPTKRIVEVSYGLYSLLNLPSGQLWLMRPSLETNFGQDMFLPGPPWELMTTGKIADVPIIIGMTKDSAKLYTLVDLPKKVQFTKQYDKYIPSDLNITDPIRRKFIGAALEQFYFHNNISSCDFEEEFTNLLNDVFVWHGIGLTSKIINSRISSPVYQFLITLHSTFGFYKSLQNVDGGVLSGDELQLLFYSTYYKNKPEPGSIMEQKINEALEIAANFCNERNPSAVMDKVKVKWEPMGNDDNYLDYGNDFIMKKSLWEDRLQLWAGISEYFSGNFFKASLHIPN